MSVYVSPTFIIKYSQGTGRRRSNLLFPCFLILQIFLTASTNGAKCSYSSTTLLSVSSLPPLIKHASRLPFGLPLSSFGSNRTKQRLKQIASSANYEFECLFNTVLCVGQIKKRCWLENSAYERHFVIY